MHEERDEGLVEVQRPDTKAWYQARIIDGKGDKFSIRYDDARVGYVPRQNCSKEIEEVPSSHVRTRPRLGDKSRLEYQIDEIVEVFTRNQKWEGEGWWPAVIKNRKGKEATQQVGNFFYVAYDNADKFDEIVEKNRLRPVNTKEPLKASDYTQISIPVRSDLLEWVQTAEEADRSLAEIRMKSNSLIVSFSPDRKNIQVVGREDSIETAKLLIDVVLSHQAEVLSHYSTSKKDASPAKDELVEEIELDTAVLTLLGGLKGTYIEAVRTRHNVGLSLVEGGRSEGKTLLRVKASSENMAAAKKELQLSAHRIVLQQSEEAYLKPKFAELQQKSKVVCTNQSTTRDEELSGKVALTAIGTEDSLRNYRLAIETFLNFERKMSEPPASDPKSGDPSEEYPSFAERYTASESTRRGYGRRRPGAKSAQYPYSAVKYVKKQ